jgi:hypothetical protein
MTGQKLDSLEQWDSKIQRVRKSYPNSVRLNNFLLNELAKANDKALELETNGHASAKEVKIGLKPVEAVPVYFKDVARQYLKDQEALGNYESYATEDGRFKRLYDFAKTDNLTFEEITVDFLQRYRIYLRQCKKPRYNENTPEKPISDRTVTNYLIGVRTIFNRAISAKLISKNIYPFGGKANISIKLGGSAKIGLEETEIRKLETLENASQHKARHSFAQRAEEKEIHPKVLQKMYRHESILTTMIYQSNFSFKKADDAIDAVLSF